MKPLWAPWRISYILDNRPDSGCFLCIRKTVGYRRRHLILAESACSYILLNRYPYTCGHMMVVPWRHVADITDLHDDERDDLFRLTQHATAAVRKALNTDGVNLGANLGRAAGAGVEEHFHFHIVPRWNGDNNFMPVISGEHVLPEYLEATYDRMVPCFETISAP